MYVLKFSPKLCKDTLISLRRSHLNKSKKCLFLWSNSKIHPGSRITLLDSKGPCKLEPIIGHFFESYFKETHSSNSASLQENKCLPAPIQVNLTFSTLSWVFIFSILICILYFCGANMKTLFICQEPLLLVIIPFIIMTLMFDSVVILGVNYTQGLIG